MPVKGIRLGGISGKLGSLVAGRSTPYTGVCGLGVRTLILETIIYEHSVIIVFK